MTEINWATALTGVDLGAIMDGIIALIPIVAPVVISLMALKKGWRFLLSQLSRA